MTQDALATKPADELPPLVMAARKLIQDLKEVHVPDGTVKDRMAGEFPIDKKTGQPVDKGLKLLLHAMAGFIARQPGENRALVARLENTDGTDIMGILADIATNPDDLQLKTQELRAALTLKGKPLFEQALLAISTAGGQKAKAADDSDGQAASDSDAPPPPPTLRGHGWRDQLKKPPVVPPDIDKIIHDEAVEYDHESGPDEKYLHKQARRYDRDHHLDDPTIREEAEEYDRLHPIDDTGIRRSADRGLSTDEGFEAGKPKKKEAHAYEDLTRMLMAEFETVLAPVLTRGPII